MRILFATNLSEPPSVTGEIQHLAGLLKADVFVLHVITPAPSAVAPIDPMTGLGGFAPYSLYDPELEVSLEKAERNAFTAFLDERFSIPVHAAIRKGNPAEVIIEDADEHEADLIIIGKRRHGRLEQLFVGSTAGEVLKRATRPTLVMPVADQGAAERS